MNQPPGRYRGQPQGQPSWDDYPPPGYPQQNSYPQQPSYPPPGPPPGYPQGIYYPPPGPPSAGPRRALSPGHQVPQAPPPRQPRRKNPRKQNAILLAIFAIAGIAALAIAASGSNGSQAQNLTAAGTPAATTTATATASPRATPKPSARPKAKATADAADACDNRPPASGDIYVRMITPGTSPQAQELGGEWRWDSTDRKCLTSVQLMIATAPQTAGNCTQVGYVADNPGYDANAAVAAPLTQVAAQTGPACPTAQAQPPASSAQAQPPASSAPASCHPLSNEGKCYEPGEYCRDDDHGASGVAGNGEPITCEYNDGWRWEPA